MCVSSQAWQAQDELKLRNRVMDVLGRECMSAAVHDTDSALVADFQAVLANGRHAPCSVRAGPEHTQHGAQQCRARRAAACLRPSVDVMNDTVHRERQDLADSATVAFCQ